MHSINNIVNSSSTALHTPARRFFNPDVKTGVKSVLLFQVEPAAQAERESKALPVKMRERGEGKDKKGRNFRGDRRRRKVGTFRAPFCKHCCSRPRLLRLH